MWRLRQLGLKLYHFLRPARAEQELTREVAAHLGVLEDEFRQQGMTADAARLAARRSFGGVEQAKERSREERSFVWLEDARRDLRHAVRMLARAPGFTSVAVMTLALGIGANTAVFSVVDTLLLRPPPFDGADRLYWIYDVNDELGYTVDDVVAPSSGNFIDWRQHNRSFDHMVAWRNWWFSIAGGETRNLEAEQVRGVHISPTFFDMLGVRAAVGRTFRVDEERPGRSRVVVLTHGFWTQRFGADPTVVGETISVDGQPHAVIGVLPRDFYFLWPDSAVFMPMVVDGAFRSGRGNHAQVVIARLAPSVTLSQAQADMDRVTRDLERAFPDTNTGWRTAFDPVFPLNPHLESTFLILLGAVGCVLLIACINLANLLLVRAGVRQREIAMRVAVGASRARLVRQLLTESALLASLGAVAGVLLAIVGLRVLTPFIPFTPQLRVAHAFTFTVDQRALLFTLGVTAVTALAFGLLPALQASRTEGLKVSAASARRATAGRALLIVEIAISLVLLVGATLLIQSLWNLQQVDPGFRPDRLITMQLWLPEEKYSDPSSVSRFSQDLLRNVDQYPEVSAAAAASTRPFLGWSLQMKLEILGRPPPPPGDTPYVGVRIISPEYLPALGAPLIRGRAFRDTDGAGSAGVALVNEAMVRRYWPTEDPIGRQMRATYTADSGPWRPDQTTSHFTIVGVVADMKEFRLSDQVEPAVYLSHLQNRSRYAHLLIRSESDSATVADVVRREIRRLDPELGVYGLQTMDTVLADAVSEPRLSSLLFWVFALVALLLSGVGVYGVTSYLISQRTGELAVRRALGARPAALFRLVTSQTATVAAVGVAIGLFGALLLSGALASLLYGVEPTDPVILVGAAGVVFAVAVVAAWQPASRATRVEPMAVLRAE